MALIIWYTTKTAAAKTLSLGEHRWALSESTPVCVADPVIDRTHTTFSLFHANFTTQHNAGPPTLQALVGQCFAADTDDNKYEYRFCPFDNVTQHDIQPPWNTYNGVLGIWHTWEVVEGTMAQLKFKEGDSCGGKQRQVTVSLVCGEANLASNPSEPNPCHDALDLQLHWRATTLSAWRTFSSRNRPRSCCCLTRSCMTRSSQKQATGSESGLF
jgi:hypothetical protein